jgi:hypothetical protein
MTQKYKIITLIFVICYIKNIDKRTFKSSLKYEILFNHQFSNDI